MLHRIRLFGLVMGLISTAVAIVTGVYVFQRAELADVSAGGVTYIPSWKIEIWLDPETGCEYIRSSQSASSFTPRLRADGRILCDDEGATASRE